MGSEMCIRDRSVIASGNVSDVFNEKTIEATYNTNRQLNGFDESGSEGTELLVANGKSA